MCSEALHHVAFVIASGAADDVGGRSEPDAARHLGWCAGRRDVVLVTGDYRPCASTGVVGGCVYRREFDCCQYGGGGRRKWGKVNGKDRKAYTQPMMQVKPSISIQQKCLPPQAGS